MHILQLNTEKGWRGGERQTLYGIEGLRSQEVSVELLARKGSPLALKASALGIPVHEAENRLLALSFLMRQGSRFDILHAQTAQGQSLALLTQAWHRRPVVYTRRVDFQPKGWFARWKYRRTERTVAISHAIAAIVRGLCPRPVEVIPSVVRPEAVSASAVAALRASLAPSGEKIIGTTAAMVPHKDPMTLVRAVVALWRMRQDFKFLHLGEGPLRPQVEEEVRRAGLQGIYLTPGFQEDIAPYFGLFDCFVMSSMQEGLGSSVLDAFLHRVPVVSTDAGGLKELVEGRGLLCGVGDAECLARSMDRMLEGDQVAERYREKAFAHVTAHHGIESAARRYIGLYRNILSDRTG
jgi:glycosyltransferase involved in cell wall biosynthesis